MILVILEKQPLFIPGIIQKDRHKYGRNRQISIRCRFHIIVRSLRFKTGRSYCNYQGTFLHSCIDFNPNSSDTDNSTIVHPKLNTNGINLFPEERKRLLIYLAPVAKIGAPEDSTCNRQPARLWRFPYNLGTIAATI